MGEGEGDKSKKKEHSDETVQYGTLSKQKISGLSEYGSFCGENMGREDCKKALWGDTNPTKAKP